MILSWLRIPRIRRGLALGAVVLSAGGLVLYKAPAQAHGSFMTTGTSALPPLGKNASLFAGPGLHGSLSMSHATVLSAAHQPVFAEVRIGADASEQPTERAPIALAIVLDTSGSMSGEKMDEGKRAVLRVLRDMRDDDEIAFVRYSDTSELVQPLARVSTVRASLEQRVRGLSAGGGTNIAPALAHGRRALEATSGPRVRRVVLVSDGLDATRVQSESIARSSFEAGITVSSLGVGLDFDESYMGAVATSGHGNFAFVKDGASLGGFLQKELVETASTTVERAKVRLRVPAGMTFVRASGADARVNGDEVELSFGSLFSGDERRAIVEFDTRLEEGETRAITASATWSRVSGGSGQADAKPVTITATRDMSEVERGRDGAVLASATSVVASQRQLEAAQAYSAGDTAKADALIQGNLRDLAEAKAAAPPAAAIALDRQAAAYSEDKKTFADPSSASGRERAKSAAAKNLNNLGRAGF